MQKQNVNLNALDNSKIPESNNTEASNVSSVSSNNKSNLRVCINRIKEEDARKLQKSIKEFARISPGNAKKIGIPLLNDKKDNDYLEIDINTSKKQPDDMFALIKAEEKIPFKRKFEENIINPEQLCKFIFIDDMKYFINM